MKIIDVIQASPEWHAARAGIPTASCFDKILTSKTLKASAQQGDYLARLVAERILGGALDETEGTAWQDRGVDMEGEAAEWYALTRGVTLDVAGFCLTDDERIGCSPDRLVGEDGGLEIKVPHAGTHVGYLLDPSSLVADYRHQVQGCLFVTERKWWDIESYNPEIPSVVVRIEPERAYQEALAREVKAFLSRLDAALAHPEVARAIAERVAREAPKPPPRSLIDEALSRPAPSPTAPMTAAEEASFDASLPF